MSISETKSKFEKVFADQNNKVVCLSGKWGTGKTHLLTELRKHGQQLSGSLYVSLFGLRTLSEVKLKLIQSIAGDGAHAAISYIPKIFDAARKLHQGFAVIDDLGAIAAPTALKSKVIIVDDFERKHRDLCSEELLGFFDEFSTIHSSRFVIVTNREEIADKESWNRLKEKVIDQQLELTTTVQEAFSIASKDSSSDIDKEISLAATECQITNIRVAKKITGIARELLAPYEATPKSTIQRIAPSIVLFTAIEYSGMADPPPLNLVLAVGTPGWFELFSGSSSGGGDEDERLALDELNSEELRTRQLRRWKALVESLGILSIDEFELLLVERLKTGVFDRGRLDALIKRYAEEGRSLELKKETDELLKSIYWDQKATSEQLIDRARKLIEFAGEIDLYTITSLAREISQLPKGLEVSEDLIKNSLASLKQKEPSEMREYDPDDDPFNRQLHPELDSAVRASVKGNIENVPLIDSIISIYTRSSWGPREEHSLRTATAEDFSTAITNCNPDQLRRLMSQMTKIAMNKPTYSASFGDSGSKFVAAVRQLVSGDNERLRSILQMSIKSFGADKLLE